MSASIAPLFLWAPSGRTVFAPFVSRKVALILHQLQLSMLGLGGFRLEPVGVDRRVQAETLIV